MLLTSRFTVSSPIMSRNGTETDGFQPLMKDRRRNWLSLNSHGGGKAAERAMYNDGWCVSLRFCTNLALYKFGVYVLLGSPRLPPYLEMFNHVEAAGLQCDSTSVASDMSSMDDTVCDLGVSPLVS